MVPRHMLLRATVLTARIVLCVKLFGSLGLVLIIAELLRAHLDIVIPNHVTVGASASLGVTSGLASGISSSEVNRARRSLLPLRGFG